MFQVDVCDAIVYAVYVPKVTVTARIEEDQHRSLVKIAAEQERTVSSVVEKIIRASLPTKKEK